MREFLPVFRRKTKNKIGIIVSFFLYSIHFLYTIEEKKNKIFKRRRFKTNEEVSSCSGIKGKCLPRTRNRHGRSKDGKKAVTAYFIMGRSENSRNRVFVEEGEGIRTQAFDPAKLRRSKPDHLCTSSCSWRRDDRYERGSDRHSI